MVHFLYCLRCTDIMYTFDTYSKSSPPTERSVTPISVLTVPPCAESAQIWVSHFSPWGGSVTPISVLTVPPCAESFARAEAAYAHATTLLRTYLVRPAEQRVC